MPNTKVDPKRVRAAKKAPATRVAAVIRVAAKTAPFLGHEQHFNSILTEKVAAKIIGYVLEGNYPKVACQAVGISYRGFQYWKARADEFSDTPLEDIPESERMFVDLFHTMAIAEAQAEIGLLRKVAEGKFGWQAAMTILERRHPERWRRRDVIEHEGGDPSRPVRMIEVPSDQKRAQDVAQILAQAEAVK